MRSMNGLTVLSLVLISLTLVTSSSAQTLKPIDFIEQLQFKPAEEDPKDDELRKLLKVRYNEAVNETTIYLQLWLGGRSTIDRFFDAQRRLLEAGLELFDKPAERIDLLTKYTETTKQAVQVAEARYNQGVLDAGDRVRARYQLADAQIHLLKAKREQ